MVSIVDNDRWSRRRIAARLQFHHTHSLGSVHLEKLNNGPFQILSLSTFPDIGEIIEDGNTLTADLGGNASTKEVGNAVIRNIIE